MSNDTLMPTDERPPRRLPWRGLIACVLLLAALGYSYIILPPVARQYRTEQTEARLILAGMVAEDVEQLIPQDASRAALTECLKTHLDVNRDIAYVRVWNQRMGLVCELTSAAPTQPKYGPGGTLADLGMPKIVKPLDIRRTDSVWLEDLTHLQGLVAAQMDISGLLDTSAQSVLTPELRSEVYVLQDETLRLAESLASEHAALEAPIMKMQQVLDAVPREGKDALYRALQASTDAEDGLTLALERHRSVADTLALPAPLATQAPPPDARWARLLPGVRGQRVVTPLFTSSLSTALTKPSGFAEVVFYERTADLVEILAERALIPMVLAVLALLMLLPLPRKRSPATS